MSKHTVPATTASGAHHLTGKVGKSALAALAPLITSPTARDSFTILRFIILLSLLRTSFHHRPFRSIID
jgi:hypothetical protein